MPMKAKKPCRYPGCSALTDQTYCKQHRAPARIEYNRFTRDPDSNKRYGRRWRERRDSYARRHPICEDCEKQGRIVPLDEVHHIVPLKLGGTNDDENLISLCKSCHQKRELQTGLRSAP